MCCCDCDALHECCCQDWAGIALFDCLAPLRDETQECFGTCAAETCGECSFCRCSCGCCAQGCGAELGESLGTNLRQCCGACRECTECCYYCSGTLAHIPCIVLGLVLLLGVVGFAWWAITAPPATRGATWFALQQGVQRAVG
jgi:hypothetical protein